jgi:hypothetical protein
MTNPVPLPNQGFQIVEIDAIDELPDTPSDRGEDIQRIEGQQNVESFYHKAEESLEIIRERGH